MKMGRRNEPEVEKNPHAQELGRLGGAERMRRLSAKGRRALARKGANAMHAKRREEEAKGRK